MQNTARALLLLGISIVMLLLHCRTTNDPQPQVTFGMLSPQEQARIRPFLKADANGNVDPEWWAIVKRTCKVNPFANCVCCDPKTARDCNPTNWQCCGSAVFQPADGSSCSVPNPCNCPLPPQSRVNGRTPASAAVH